MTLYARAQTLYAGDELKQRLLERNHHVALKREDEPTCLASNRERQDSSFDDSFFQISEKDIYTSRIASEFSKDVCDTQYISSSTTFDCSHIHFSKLSASPEIAGFCLGIGAPRSIVGRTELNKILTSVQRRSIARINSRNSFSFEDVLVKSLGMVELCLRTPNDVPNIMVVMHIVPVNVPALLGLDVMDAEGLYADIVTNRLVHRKILSRSSDEFEYDNMWSIPIIRHC